MFGSEERLVELRRQIDTLEGEFLEVLAEYDHSRDWETAGDFSAAAALRQLCRMDRGRATNEVALARKTAELPQTRAALCDGAISRSHVLAIADAFTPERAEMSAPLAGATPELIDAIRKERRYRGPLSRGTLDRIMCEAEITRVLMACNSEILDVGRATRTVTWAQWNALVARNDGCTTPGCHAPPDQCEVHHRQSWSQGGSTDIDNRGLLCWRHHRQKHGERERRPINIPTDRAA